MKFHLSTERRSLQHEYCSCWSLLSSKVASYSVGIVYNKVLTSWLWFPYASKVLLAFFFYFLASSLCVPELMLLEKRAMSFIYIIISRINELTLSHEIAKSQCYVAVCRKLYLNCPRNAAKISSSSWNLSILVFQGKLDLYTNEAMGSERC